MNKPGAIFVAVAMTVTAACVGVIASFGLGASFGSAALAAGAALICMAVTQLAFARAPAPDFARLEDLDRVVTDIQSRVETMEARLSAMDGQNAERSRAAVKPLVEELASLGGLVTSIAREVAAHDAKFGEIANAKALERATPQRAAPATTPPAPPPAPVRVEAPPVLPPEPRRQPATAKAAPEPFDLDAEPAPRADVRLERALREGRIDIHLQPIVSLPSRRTTHYEAFARIVEQDGVIEAQDFVADAIAAKRIAAVDRATLDRATLVAQRLAAGGREDMVFVNVAPASLADDAYVAALNGALDRTPDIARMIALELTQSTFRALPPAEQTTVESLAARGLRLSIDQATDLRLDGRDLAQRGVRFVKVPAARLLDPAAGNGAAIHPADLAGLLERQGVRLIASHVEEERTVPELLDMEVAAAQGHLFGLARPVRPPSGEQAANQSSQFRLVPRSLAAR